MVEIDPCPFCNGKPSFKEDLYGFYAKPYMFTHTCKGRKPQLNIFSNGYVTKQEAIEAWNKREEKVCHNIDRFEDFKCSNCGGEMTSFYDNEYGVCPDYCPDCGAKVMDDAN